MRPADHIILVVDDDPSLLGVTEGILGLAGYATIAASGPLEALRKSRNFEVDIHLLLTDVDMPEMDGLALAACILAERAHTRVLLVSGVPPANTKLPLLKKPFGGNELLEEVARVIAGAPTLLSDVYTYGGCSLDRVGAALQSEVDEARRKYLDVTLGFLNVTGDVPSGIPNPDGALRLQLVTRDRQRAFDVYQRARKKLEDYVSAERRNKNSGP
jgi:CheY-like chemotaxis protein